MEEFVTDLQPPILAQLVRVVFDRMQRAEEAGSLLMIRADIADAVAEAKKQRPTGLKEEQLVLGREDKRPQAELQPMAYNVLSRRRVSRQYEFDELVAWENTREYTEYTADFQRVRGQPHLQKGMLRMWL